jgi:predicted DNA-binding transcriptional regulator AlpA
MSVSLTAPAVAALKPRADPYHVRDAKVTGLELRVAADGSKIWSLRYRVYGYQRRLKLGAYPRLSLAKARARANVELRKVDSGVDPQAERQEAQRAARAEGTRQYRRALRELHRAPRQAEETHLAPGPEQDRVRDPTGVERAARLGHHTLSLAPPVKLSPMLSPRRLGELLGISQATLWRMVQRGDLPPQTRISVGRVGWAEAEIVEWLASRRVSPPETA